MYNTHPGVRKMNFEEVYNDFKTYVKNRHKKQGFYNITHDFECRVLPYFKFFDIYEISKSDLIKWQDTILSFNFTNSYNKRLYYVFNLYLDYCCKYLDLPSNQLRDIGSFPKKIEQRKTDYYTLKEFEIFIRQIDNKIYKQYFNLMFFTGTRPGEAMALKFSDLDRNYLTINKSIQRKGKRDFDTPKNEYSIRKILISNILKKELLKLKELYIKNYGDISYDYFIFGGLKPLSPTSIDRVKRNACEKAKLKCITQHQFRHSYATNLINKGIPINTVSKLLGHSNIEVTARVYIHNNLEHEKRVLRILSFQNFKTYVKNQLAFILKQF